MAGVTFDIAQILWHFVLILLCYFGSIDPSGWIASSTTALIFFGSLGLRLISRKRGLGLSLIFILGGFIAGLSIGDLFVFLCRQAITFWVPEINFPNVERWL